MASMLSVASASCMYSCVASYSAAIMKPDGGGKKDDEVGVPDASYSTVIWLLTFFTPCTSLTNLVT